MKSETVAIGAALALGAGALLLLGRRSDAASPSAPGDPGAYGYGGGYGAVDPWSGLPIDPTTGLPTPGAPVPSVALSPPSEAAIIADNRRANDQLLSDNRDSEARTEANTRASNAFQAAAVTASTVPFALYGIAKYGPQLGASLGRGVNAITRAAANVVPRFAAPGATIGDWGALTATGAAVGVAGGAALGLGTVKVLDATGALNALERAGSSFARSAPASVQAVVKTAAQPLSYLGAVATGLVGHGSIPDNLQKAYNGTLTQRVLSGGLHIVRRWF